MTNKFIQNIDSEIKPQEKEKLEEELPLNEELEHLQDLAIPCNPIRHGGKYPMWIIIPYSQTEHLPAHAHLYSSGKKPTKANFITKFIISDNPPKEKSDIKVMKGEKEVPSEYAKLIIEWAADSERGINNWDGLIRDRERCENALKAGFLDEGLSENFHLTDFLLIIIV